MDSQVKCIMHHPIFHWLYMTVVPILQIKTLPCEPVFMIICKGQAEPLLQARLSDSKVHIQTHRSGTLWICFP